MSDEKQTKSEEIDREGFKRFVNEFKGETDRAAVIIGAAKLEYLLYQILSSHFVPSPGNYDDLLDSDSPLATFSSKINIAFRVGLIDAQFARALHLIRRIRNSFAHEATGVKLDSGSHRDRVKELAAPLKNFQDYEKFKVAFFHEKDGTTGDFYTTLAIMVVRLDNLFHIVKQIDNSDAHTFIPPTYKKRHLEGKDLM
jgi:hypothetical protein